METHWSTRLLSRSPRVPTVDRTHNAITARRRTVQHLRHVNVCDTVISDLALRSLSSSFPGLLSLNVDFCPNLTDDGLRWIACMSQLQDLRMVSTNFTDAGMATIAAMCVELRRLNIRSCRRISSAGIRSLLAPLACLQELTMGLCDNLTDDGLANIAALHCLQYLNIGGCSKITATTGISGLVYLQRLRMSNCCFSDDSVASLHSLQRLIELDIAFCSDITDSGVTQIASLLPQLQCLSMAWCGKVTDSGLHSVGSMIHLTSVRVSACSAITDAGLGHLGGCVRLERLDVSHCVKITNLGFVSLFKALLQLRVLVVSGCPLITDDALLACARAGSLRLQQLTLQHCSGITAAGVQAARSLAADVVESENRWGMLPS
jgi:F-box and leucine-rich repeat protein 14